MILHNSEEQKNWIRHMWM